MRRFALHNNQLIVRSVAFLTAIGYLPHPAATTLTPLLPTPSRWHPPFLAPPPAKVAATPNSLMRQWRVLSLSPLCTSVRHNTTPSDTPHPDTVPLDIATAKANGVLRLFKQHNGNLTVESLQKELNSAKPILREKEPEDGYKSLVNHLNASAMLRVKDDAQLVEFVGEVIIMNFLVGKIPNHEIFEKVWVKQESGKKAWGIYNVPRDLETKKISSEDAAPTDASKQCLCLIFCGSSGCGKTTALNCTHFLLEEAERKIRYIRVKLDSSKKSGEDDEDSSKKFGEGDEEKVRDYLKTELDKVFAEVEALDLTPSGMAKRNTSAYKKKYRLLFLLDEIGQNKHLVRHIVHLSRQFHSVIAKWFGEQKAKVFAQYVSGWNFVMAGTSGDSMMAEKYKHATDSSQYHVVNLDLPCMLQGTEPKTKQELDMLFRRQLLKVHLPQHPTYIIDSLLSRSTCDIASWNMLRNPRCVGDGLAVFLNPPGWKTGAPQKTGKQFDDSTWYDPVFHKLCSDWSGLNQLMAFQYCQLNGLKDYATHRRSGTFYSEQQQLLLVAFRVWVEETQLGTEIKDDRKADTAPTSEQQLTKEKQLLGTEIIKDDRKGGAAPTTKGQSTKEKQLQITDFPAHCEKLHRLGLTVLGRRGDALHMRAPPSLVGVVLSRLGVGFVKESMADAAERLTCEYFGLRLASMRFKLDPVDPCDGSIIPDLSVPEQEDEQPLDMCGPPKEPVTVGEVLPTLFVKPNPTEQTSNAAGHNQRKASKHKYIDSVLDAQIAIPEPDYIPDYVVVNSDIWLSGKGRGKQPKEVSNSHQDKVTNYWERIISKLALKHSMVIVRNAEKAPEADCFIIIRLKSDDQSVVHMLLVRVQVKNYGPTSNPSTFFDELAKLGGTPAEVAELEEKGVVVPAEDQNKKKFNDRHNQWIKDAGAKCGKTILWYHGWLFVTSREVSHAPAKVSEEAKRDFLTWMRRFDTAKRGHMPLPRMLGSLVIDVTKESHKATKGASS